MSIIPALTAHDEALPQLIGEFKPVDDWQAHINAVFYGLRGGRVRDYYQTMASADYRLAHALAVDYYENVSKHPSPDTPHPSRLWNGAAATATWPPAS